MYIYKHNRHVDIIYIYLTIAAIMRACMYWSMAPTLPVCLYMTIAATLPVCKLLLLFPVCNTIVCIIRYGDWWLATCSLGTLGYPSYSTCYFYIASLVNWRRQALLETLPVMLLCCCLGLQSHWYTLTHTHTHTHTHTNTRTHTHNLSVTPPLPCR